MSMVECRKKANRVKRGGSWNNNAENIRSANRNNNTPSNNNNNIGFRLSNTILCLNRDVQGYFGSAVLSRHTTCSAGTRRANSKGCFG